MDSLSVKVRCIVLSNEFSQELYGDRTAIMSRLNISCEIQSENKSQKENLLLMNNIFYSKTSRDGIFELSPTFKRTNSFITYLSILEISYLIQH